MGVFPLPVLGAMVGTKDTTRGYIVLCSIGGIAKGIGPSLAPH